MKLIHFDDIKLIHDLDEQRYHSQVDHDEPVLTASIAKTILQKSLAHAWYSHPKGGGAKKEPTAAMELGTLLHDVLLNNGDRIKVIDAKDYRTNLAKEEKAFAKEEGKIPVLKHKMEEINNFEKAVTDQINDIFPAFFDVGHFTELSVYWKAALDVKCQSRWDWISPNNNLIIDIKTTSDASTDACRKKIVQMNYHVQQAMYTSVANGAWPGLPFHFRFLFIETEPPYAINFIELDENFIKEGKRKATIAINNWENALKTKTFPGYGENILTYQDQMKE